MLSWLTIGYNVIEGLVSVYFGVEEASVSLAAFGVDSFVEVASAVVILWRFRGEQGRAEAISKDREIRALRSIGVLFLLLASGTVLGAVIQLIRREHPGTTVPGVVISALSLALMYWLYRAKLETGQALNSRSVISDAICSKACIQLSGVLLVGSGLFWLTPSMFWIDSVAAIGIAYLIAKEGIEMLRAEEGGSCGCDSTCGD